MHAVVQERRAMRRKIVVLFVAFASVFGVVACGGAVEVEEGPEEEAREAKKEVKEAKEEVKEAEQEVQEAGQATKDEMKDEMKDMKENQ